MCDKLFCDNFWRIKRMLLGLKIVAKGFVAKFSSSAIFCRIFVAFCNFRKLPWFPLLHLLYRASLNITSLFCCQCRNSPCRNSLCTNLLILTIPTFVWKTRLEAELKDLVSNQFWLLTERRRKEILENCDSESLRVTGPLISKSANRGNLWEKVAIKKAALECTLGPISSLHGY